MNVLTVKRKAREYIPEVEALARVGLLFLVSRASIIGVFPFGLGFWAAVVPEKNLILGLFGMILGIFSAGGEILRYTLASGLFLVYTYFRKNRVFDSLFCGFFMFISGVISILFNGQAIVYIAAALMEGVISSLVYILSRKGENFYKSYKGIMRASREEIISAVLLCGIVLSGFSGVYVTKDLSLAKLLGVYFIMCLSRCTSLAASGSIGLALGFICSMNTSIAISVMGAFGVSAVLSNIFKEFGKIGSSAGFLIGCVLCAIYSGNFLEMPITLYEAIIGIAMFMVTPKLVFVKIESVLLKTMEAPIKGKEMRLKEYLSGELKQISKAFLDLADGFISLSHQSEKSMQASDMFDDVAQRVCKKCPKWGECWIDGFDEMYRYMYEILNVIETKGGCDKTNIPIVFSKKCIKPEEFIVEFNHLYELYKQSAMWHGEVSFGQDMVAQQYHEISGLISDLSNDVETGFSFLESAELKLDSALEKVGFFTKEINVIENIHHEPEVYISSGFGAEPEMLEKVISQVMGMPMHLENDTSSMKFVAHNRYYVEYAVCQHSGEAEQICGDTVMQFETEDNKFCVLLCDGMGSGLSASKESKLTAELLQDFIKAGFIKDKAIRMINSTLAMKAGRESFSTIDLAEVNLRTGQAEFIKVGASESYLMHNDKVEIISARALPVGILDQVQTSAITRTLNEEDVVVMASDGISDSGYGVMHGAWVKKLIKENKGDMQTLADEIMKNARQKAYPKPCDDMTVVALRIKKAI